MVNNAIPGEVVYVEESSEKKNFETKTIRDIGEKAKGELIVYNTYSSDPQPLVSGTRFQAENGKIYRINKDVTIAGATIEGGQTIAGRTSIFVEADEFGEEYLEYMKHSGKLVPPLRR